jgi:hypothetical protein
MIPSREAKHRSLLQGAFVLSLSAKHSSMDLWQHLTKPLRIAWRVSLMRAVQDISVVSQIAHHDDIDLLRMLSGRLDLSFTRLVPVPA